MKLGKLPARKDSVKLKLGSYISSLPTPPKTCRPPVPAFDLSWGMLGNDKYGDCVWAGADHETMYWNKEAGVIAMFTDTNALSDYSVVTGFNPNDPTSDQGTDMQVAASYRLKTGVIDSAGKRHQVAAYVAITPGNVDEMKQAIYLFGAAGIGFQFPNYAMDEFNAGQTWHVKTGWTIDGGHYVPAIGYDSRYVYVVTWGKVQKMTWGFFKKYSDEAIAYVSSEFMTGDKSPAGFNLAALQADVAQFK